MALNTSPESSSGVLGAIKNALGLFGDTNKTNPTTEDTNPKPTDEYTSKMDDVEIISLTSGWKRDFETYFSPIRRGNQLSFDYWVGKQRNPESTTSFLQVGNDVGNIDNKIFESIETFLPIATRSNPEAIVKGDPSDIGQSVAKDVQVALAHEADVQKLRRKLARMTRGWLLNRLGVIKVSWDTTVDKGCIRTKVVDAKYIILDPNGYIDEGGHFQGEFVGQKIKISAGELVKMFPSKRMEIMKKASQKKGTILEYIEWWYHGTDLFYTIEDLVLDKFKNPNWNYDGTVTQKDPDSDATYDLDVQGTNHLDKPCDPFVFLSIFTTGEQPHDNTSLILQNIPGQDSINRRESQIDRNVEGMNNGMIVNGDMFTEEQAAGASSALKRGVTIRTPSGKPQDAVMFPERRPLPGDVYVSLRDRRSEIANIFGTAGSTAQGTQEQDTVRGKILVNQMDSSRIGGGITECIEQVADSIYNLWVQFMFVYYDEEHFINSAGATSGMELITLKNDRFPLIKGLDVTVKEGSLVPKDPLTQRNEAIDLWSENAIDPRSLYKKLDFPDPDEATNQLILWQMLQKGAISPEQYLPSFTAGQPPGAPQQGQLPAQGQPTQPGTGGPAVSPPSNQGVQNPAQPAPNLGSVEAQSKQLLQSEPLK